MYDLLLSIDAERRAHARLIPAPVSNLLIMPGIHPPGKQFSTTVILMDGTLTSRCCQN